MAKEMKGKRICKCECGGEVRGFDQFDRLWTWCEKCTPIVKVNVPALVGQMKDR